VRSDRQKVEIFENQFFGGCDQRMFVGTLFSPPPIFVEEA
jgi:hypothetical protein